MAGARREARAAQAAARREARAAHGGAAGETVAAEGDPAGAAEEERESAEDRSEGTEASGECDGQSNEPSKVSVPKLPSTIEEFHALLGRALDLEGEGEAQHLLSMLTGPLWDRLHWWTRREEEETEKLEQLFQEGGGLAAGVPACFDDLLNRVFDIKIVLSMADGFVARMNIPTKRIAGDLEWWLEQRARIIESRGQKSKIPVRPPAKRPVGTTADQPNPATSGSQDPSAAA